MHIPDHLQKYFKPTEHFFISGKSWADYDSNDDELPPIPWCDVKKHDDNWTTVTKKKNKR
jgi:hypothetical protein